LPYKQDGESKIEVFIIAQLKTFKKKERVEGVAKSVIFG